jgi:F0F1-type ATP synthase assembly protein I
VDAADQSAREKKGYGDGLTQALTLVVGPVLFGLLGAFLDSKLGTAPLFLLVFGLFGVLAASVTAFYEYRGRMERHDEGKPWTRRMQ